MCHDSPITDVTLYLMSDYMARGVVVPGTIIARVHDMGHSPLHCMFNRDFYNVRFMSQSDGVVDSLRHLIKHENYLKPYSDEHLLVRLLTRAF